MCHLKFILAFCYSLISPVGYNSNSTYLDYDYIYYCECLYTYVRGKAVAILQYRGNIHGRLCRYPKFAEVANYRILRNTVLGLWCVP